MVSDQDNSPVDSSARSSPFDHHVINETFLLKSKIMNEIMIESNEEGSLTSFDRKQYKNVHNFEMNKLKQ